MQRSHGARGGARLGGAALVLVCCAMLALGWWAKARCLPGGWERGEEYLQWCYTDLYALYFDARAAEGARPYLDHPLEYPVLTGAQLALVTAAAHRLGPPPQAAAAFHLTALLHAGALLASLWLLAAVADGTRLWWFAASPLLALHAFTNWDAVPVLLLTGACAAHLRGRDGVSGVLAGLGAAAKVFPGILVPLVVLTRLVQRRPGDALRHAGAALSVWVGVNLPVWLAAPEGWSRFFTLNRERTANFDSLWFLVEQVRGQPFAAAALNAGAGALLVLGAVAIVVAGTRRLPVDQWWRLALPLLVWLLLSSKVYSPQYSLWLLPLAVLALPRLLPYLAFLAADVLVVAVEFPFLAGVVGHPGAPGYPWLAAALVARAAALLWLLLAVMAPASLGQLRGPAEVREARA